MPERLKNAIPPYIRLLLKLYGLNLVIFFCFRFIFYSVNQSADTGEVPWILRLKAFRIGLEFDSAVFSWIAFLPTLLWTLAALFPKYLSFLYRGTYIVFVSMLAVYYFICTVDIPCYDQFGSHLNRNALLWKESPGFMLSMIFGSFAYWGYLLLFIAIVVPAIYVFNRQYRVFKNQLAVEKHPKWYVTFLAFGVAVGLLIGGARGRIMDRDGLQEGIAIVSEHAFTNQIAINPNFTFWKSIVYDKGSSHYEVPADIDADLLYTRHYLGAKTPYQKNIDREVLPDSGGARPYNVVIVIMESMSVYKMGYYGGNNLTPNLHALNRESVFCENFFSSGIHTYNGLFSTVSGFPAILAEKSMRSYIKAPFSGIGSLLKEHGYDTYSYITHDPNFDNMSGFYKLNGFEHFISEYDFNFGQAVSALGVPDHLLFDKLIETQSNRKSERPFLAVLMTASDHGPWKIPQDIPFKPNGANEKENCTLYADWAIGRFMNEAKKQSWYKNTVFIFLGDHGLSMGHTYEMPISYNHIPCIIHQPKLFKADTIRSPCYQPDIPATVMGILNLPYTNRTFGVDVFKEKHPYVMFSADDKIGCVTSDGYYYFKLLTTDTRYLRKYKNLDPVNYAESKKVLSDSLDKGIHAIFESARYIIRKEHYLYDN